MVVSADRCLITSQRDHQSTGLASLLHETPEGGVMTSLRGRKMTPLSTVAYVLDLNDDENVSSQLASQPSGSSGGAVDYRAVCRYIEARLAAETEAASQQESNTEGHQDGRVGPPDVQMVTIRGNCDQRGHSLLSKANFSSVRGNVAVIKGKWMYEVQLGSSGILQIGWTPPNARFTSEQGVGDAQHSYAYDGKRIRKWNVAAAVYGERWTAGDILTCAIDLDIGSISYWRNGRPLGVAFEKIQRLTPGHGYYPGISLSYAEQCEVNFGGRPFTHPIEGYKALQEPLPAAKMARSDYLVSCLDRLVDMTTPRPVGADTPRGAAALAAARAMPRAYPVNCGEDTSSSSSSSSSSTSSENGDICEENRNEEVREEVKVEVKVEEEEISEARGVPLSSEETSIEEERMDSSPLVVVDPILAPSSPLTSVKEGLDALQLDSEHAVGVVEKEAEGNLKKEEESPPLPVAPLPPSEALLLAAALAPHLGEVFGSEYVVESSVMPLLRTAEGVEEGAGLDRLLRVLCAVLEPQELKPFISLVARIIGRTVSGCVWSASTFPESQALSALRFWERMLLCPAWRTAWLESDTWREELETFLIVRQPSSPQDLAAAMPNLAWRQGEDFPTVLAGSTGDGEFVRDIANLDSGLRGLEEMHAALFGHLCAGWKPFNHPDRMYMYEALGEDIKKSGIVVLPSLEALRNSVVRDTVVVHGAGGLEEQQQEQQQLPESSIAVVQGEALEGSSSVYNDAVDETGVEAQSDTTFLPFENINDVPEISKKVLSGISVITGPPQHLNNFLSWLVDKNEGSGRNVPPPGLSPGSALVSTFFALQRLLRPFLEQVHLAGEGYQFPAMALIIHGNIQMSGPPQVPRLGGTWSHLVKECLPQGKKEGKDMAAPLQVPAAAKRDNWLAPAPQVPQHLLKDWQDDWNWWLLDRALVVYSLGVSTRMRLGFTHLATLEQALASLQVMADRLEGERSAHGRTLLRMSIEELQKTILDSLRQYTWHATWLLEGWKQETCLAMAAVVSRLLEAVAARPGTLLQFVPELYLESTLDMWHCARRTEHRVWPSAEAMMHFGLDSAISATITLSADSRIVSPEARVMLVQSLWALLKEDDCLPSVMHNATAAARLLPSLITLLGDNRAWVQVANTMGLLVESSGFCPRISPLAYAPTFSPAPAPAPLPATTTAAENNEVSNEASTLVANLVARTERFEAMQIHGAIEGVLEDRSTIASWLKPAVQQDPKLGDVLLNSLFDRVNWSVTELLVALEEMDGTGSADQRGMAHQQRRCGATAALCHHLLRFLEFTCCTAPQLILGKGKGLNMTRLAEIVAFGLRQLAPGSKADAILARRGADPKKHPSDSDRRVRTSLGAELLAPYLGMIAALQVDSLAIGPSPPDGGPSLPQEGTFDPSAAHDLAHRSLVLALNQQGVTAELVEKALFAVTKMAEAHPSTGDAKLLQPPGLTAAIEALRRVSGSPGPRTEKKDGASCGVDSTGVDSNRLEEPPAEFLDPIMQTIMEDPVKLPHSGVVVDRATIQRHLLSSATDPFSRAPLTAEEVCADDVLREKIEAWNAKREM